MKPGFHVALAPVAAIPVFAASGSIALAAVAAFVEVGVDIDHHLEYCAMTRRLVGFRAFLRDYSTFDLPRVFYIFHSYELCLLLGLAAWFGRSALIGAVFAGAFVHLVVDEIGNRFLPDLKARNLFYFFAYRLLKKFRTPDLILQRQSVAGKSNS